MAFLFNVFLINFFQAKRNCFFLGGVGVGMKLRSGSRNVSNQEKIIQYLILTINNKKNGYSHCDKNEKNVHIFKRRKMFVGILQATGLVDVHNAVTIVSRANSTQHANMASMKFNASNRTYLKSIYLHLTLVCSKIM